MSASGCGLLCFSLNLTGHLFLSKFLNLKKNHEPLWFKSTECLGGKKRNRSVTKDKKYLL